MERTMKHHLSCAMLALLLGGCAMASKDVPPKPFSMTRWAVVLERPLPGEPPNFRFADGRMEGFAGCNQVTARYVQDTVGARYLTLGRIEAGRRACDELARSAEAHVLGILQSVTSYTITGDLMVMSGSSGLLRLKALPAEAKY
jgi:heat shock protein HslJ